MGFSLRNSRLVSVGVAGIIAVGVLGAGGVALADDDPGSGVPAQGERHPRPIKVGIQSLLKDSGVTREELKEGAQSGLTLGQIIDQFGDVSADQAKANALAALATKLDEAVAGGELTQEQADKIETAAPALLDRLLAAVPGEHKGDRPHAPKVRAIAKNALETVAEVLGTDVASLREELKSGKTIAEVAGPQAQAVIDALTADANAAIDNAVAEGKLPADKAESAKERVARAIDKLVNEGRPGHGQRGPANSR